MAEKLTYFQVYTVFSVIFFVVAIGSFSVSGFVYFLSEINKSEFEKEREKNDGKLPLSHIFAWLGFALILFSSPALIYMLFIFFKSLFDNHNELDKPISETAKKVEKLFVQIDPKSLKQNL
jgi:formate hydrogenlyase subunit 3/multisubunit Na+/H+ antiporter MnhD subunit